MTASRITDADGTTWAVEVIHVQRGLYEFRVDGKFGGYLGRNWAAEGCEPSWSDDQGEVFGRTVKDALPAWRAAIEERLRRGRLLALYY